MKVVHAYLRLCAFAPLLTALVGCVYNATPSIADKLSYAYIAQEIEIARIAEDTNQEWISVERVSQWKNLNNGVPTDTTVVWVRLRFTAHSGTTALLLSYAHGPYQLYLNGTPFYDSRQLRGYAPVAPQLLVLPPPLLRSDDENLLAIRTEVYSGWGGFRIPVEIGDYAALQRRYLQQRLRYSAYFAAQIALALLFLFFWLYQRNQRYFLYFSTLSALAAIWAAGYFGFLLEWTGSTFIDLAATYGSGIAIPLLFYLFVADFLVIKRSRWRALVLLPPALLLGALLLELSATGELLWFNRYLYEPMLQFALAVYLTTLVVVLLRARRLHEPLSAYAIALGISLNLAAIFFSILAMELYPQLPILLSEGQLAMTLCFALILARSYSLLGRKLESANVELRRIDRLKSDFLATTSHELRTPLNGIQGIAESLLAGAVGPLTADQKQSLQLVVQSSRRLTHLVNDILDFEMIERGRMQLQIRRVDLRSMSDAVIHLFRRQATLKGLDLINDIAHDSFVVLGDESRLQQVLTNLIGNAIKFTRQGEIVVSAAISRNHDSLHLLVRDTGIGMTSEQLQRIFKPFEQGDSTITREYGGTGIGLAISRQIAELHGGTLTATSHPGEGSIFVLALPLTESDTTDEVESADALAKAETKRSEDDSLAIFSGWSETLLPTHYPVEGRETLGRVLLVDDELINHQVLRNLLLIDGYEMIGFTNPRAAATYMESDENLEDLDLVVLDVMMPQISGVELLQRLRRRFDLAQLPVVLLTARGRTEDMIEGLNLGANDYVVKPFHTGELRARISGQVQLRRARASERELVGIERELQIARDVQESILLPVTRIAAVLAVPPESVALTYRPMNRTVGGDYYSFIAAESDLSGNVGISFLIADATGHGFQAALSTMQLDVVFRSAAALSPGALLSSLNSFFLHRVASANFFTIFAGRLEESTLRYATAGHPKQYILRRQSDGSNSEVGGGWQLITLKAKGIPIGAIEVEGDFAEESQEIEPGDLLLLFTDGLVEEATVSGIDFMEDALFEKRLLTLTAEADGQPARLHELLLSEFAWHRNGRDPHDDMVLIITELLSK